MARVYVTTVRFGDEGSWRLLGVTILLVVLLTINTLYSAYQESIDAWWESGREFRESRAARRAGICVSWLVLTCRTAALQLSRY